MSQEMATSRLWRNEKTTPENSPKTSGSILRRWPVFFTVPPSKTRIFGLKLSPWNPKIIPQNSWHYDSVGHTGNILVSRAGSIRCPFHHVKCLLLKNNSSYHIPLSAAVGRIGNMVVHDVLETVLVPDFDEKAKQHSSRRTYPGL